MTLVPEGYFADGELCSSSPAAALLAVRAGPTREGLAPLLGALRRSGDYRFRSFAELGVDGIVEHTGLTPDAARLANARESSEPLLWEDTEAALEAFARALAGEGLSCVRGGRFVHVLGKSDKASAVRDLHQRMESVTGATIERVVLGDGPNDLAMLGEADVAVVIKARHAHPMPLEASGEVLRTRDAGPAGWAEAMLNILWTRGLVTLEDGSAATGGETGG
jgi:mannosyl-3-phosphoglycerate phosphatase